MNRCLTRLSNADYANWDQHLASISFAFNTMHRKATGCSPFEIAHGMAATTGVGSPAIQRVDWESPTQAQLKGSAIAIKKAADEFIKLAKTQQDYIRFRDLDALNRRGRAMHQGFAVGDRVKIFRMPTQAQAIRNGRKVKHLRCWIGPLTIIKELSPNKTAYRMKSTSGRIYERTLLNIRPYRSSRTATPQRQLETHDLDDEIGRKEIIAVRDSSNHTAWWLGEVTQVSENHCVVHYYGTNAKKLKISSVFRKVWIDQQHRPHLGLRRADRRQRKPTPWTGRIDITNDSCILARHLILRKQGQLSTQSFRTLTQRLFKKSLHHAKFDDKTTWQ